MRPGVESVEVAVVGAGVMGSATAWRLARRGRETLLLERFPLGHPHGSSHGPTRIFRYAYGDPLYVGMAQRSLPLWRQLEAEAGETLLDLTGGIDIGPAESLEPVARALEQCGARYELLDDPAARFPGVRSEDPALFSPDTGIVAAAASVRAMARLAGERGAVVRDGAPARIEEVEEDRVLLALDGERIAARACVLAAGAWTASLLGPHAGAPPLEVTREQIVYFRELSEFPVLVDRSTAPRFRFACPSRFGAPGARAGHHRTGPAVSPDDPAGDDAAAVDRLVAFAAASLPAVRPEPVATEICLYTNTPDDDFVIDRVGALVIASPCSGHGFKFAPFVGEILARLALGEDPGMDLARFRLARFQDRPPRVFIT